MGFLIGLSGLFVGVIGFWADFSANPFSGQASTTNFDMGAVGIAVAIAGFVIQMWPRRRGATTGAQTLGQPTPPHLLRLMERS